MINAGLQLLEQVQQAHQRQSARITILGVFRLTVFILTISFVITASVLTIARSRGSHLNPFAAYTNLFPGQPWENAETFGFECRVDITDQHFVENCSSEPETGIFSRVYISGFQGANYSVGFTLREAGLTLGDVALAFGWQASRGRSRNTWFVDELRVHVWLPPGPFGYFQPVQYVYLD